MAPDFLLPDNILERMEFKWAAPPDAADNTDSNDANSTDKTSGDTP
ncbi:MAG: hypothetical protein GWO86_01545 [Planctomycetes bacterium]|nr:hypothetical protein [Planctomycetota bacterium]